MLRATFLFSIFYLFFTSVQGQTNQQILASIEEKEQLAANFLEEGSTIEGIQITREIISLAEQLNDVEHRIKIYLNFVALNNKVADYEISEKFLQKVEELSTAEELSNYLLEVSFLRTEMLLLQAEFKEALLIAHKNYSNLRTIGDTGQLIKVLSQIANSYLYVNHYDSSLLYWNHLISVGREVVPSRSLTEALQYKAFVLIKLDRMDSVLSILNSSIRYAKLLNDLELEVEGYFSLGHFYLEAGNLDESLKYLNLSNQLSAGKGLIHSDQSIASLYHQLFTKRNNYKEALFWYKRNELLLDSLSNRSYSIQIENEKSKGLLQQRENQLLLQTSSNKNKQIVIIALSLGMLSLVLIFILQRRLLKLRHNTSKNLEEKNDEIAVQNEELQQQQSYLMDKNNFIESRNSRLQTFLSQLEQLTNSYHINKGKKQEAFKEICRLTHECLKVTRVSIWKYDASNNSIIKETLLENGLFDNEPLILYAKDYPKYFEAIKKKLIIAADDAVNDTSTSEFAKGYLDVLNIKSMIDAPYLFNGEFAGVICCEHQGEYKSWDSEDTIFLKSLSDFISITLLSEQSLSYNKELKIINESLEDTVGKRTSELEEQNNQLREYAFINSHLLRAPLARVLGLSFLISKEATSIKDKELISNLLGSAKELDEIVKNISDILYDGNNLTRDDILAMIEKKLDATGNK